jgi:holo-[acyl-carrier protein] synthase
MRKGIKWSDIEVFHFPGGKPGLRIHGFSSNICQEKSITSLHLSLSDEGDYGVAVVILEESHETC